MEPTGGGRLIIEPAIGAGVIGYHASGKVERTPLFDRVLFDIGEIPITGSDLTDCLALILTIILIIRGIRALRRKVGG